MHSMRLFTVLHPREKLRRFNHDVGMLDRYVRKSNRTGLQREYLWGAV
jgi:septation ring formation regulator EzrA